MRSIGRVIVAALLSAALVASCGVDTNVIGTLPDASAPAAFGEVDSGAVTPEAGLGLISYCPSSQCPPGWTTCPDSRFPCDTNILADSRNCGGCGMACPPGTGAESFFCNEGACKLECAFGAKDCDGLIDNGCESDVRDPANCGACGVACAVGERCQWRDDLFKEVGCGCPPGQLDCGLCTDVRANDANCGACDNACDPTGGPDAPQYANMYYGCLSSQCGKFKCEGGFADCDGKLENGCETSTFTDDNCGYCGNKCGAGQKCVVDAMGQPSCMCDEGLTFCQTGDEKHGLPEGYCVDVSSSASNCGACGVSCPYLGVGYSQRVACDFGKCVLRCQNGAADCNGSQSDGCEIDTRSDPRNCGGCGITCDLKMGQACVAGKCVVEPCDQADAGEVTR
ncbi:MAG: hypothetical protein BGO98_33925 [Myxococcales bacterium 68-20]|nr:hypothetical protein [Myxococcales bacterium]OJY25625.1 MAG: hypothetical protein BGO98_33925 [Myxococcales bacterium 68-20]